jgi:hypothetical protein
VRALPIFILTVFLSWLASARDRLYAADEATADGAREDNAFPDSALTFLFRLQSRDRRFDNFTVEAETSWLEKVNPQAIVDKTTFEIAMGPHGIKPPTYPDPIPAPYDQPHRVLYNNHPSARSP